MTKHIGNRVGYAVSSITDGGIFNSFSQFYFRKTINLGPLGFGGNAGGFQPGNGYFYHTFTSSGTFTATAAGTVEVFLVGGGGGAGTPLGSGGGAGGLVYHTAFPISAGVYSVNVGDGGTFASGTTPATGPTGAKGGASTFGGMTADGGGGGSRFYADPITPPATVTGGSGGGYSPFTGTGNATQPGLNAPFVPNPNFAQYGFAGAPSGDPIGGAGGGAGGAGSAGTGGNGRQYPQFTGPLIGVPSLAPLSGYFAGGGAGGSRSSSLSGGLGGGGSNPGASSKGTDGTTNSGGGAGGGTYTSPAAAPFGTGGPGIVIIRYLI